jgi:hypothetical protein
VTASGAPHGEDLLKSKKVISKTLGPACAKRRLPVGPVNKTINK